MNGAILGWLRRGGGGGGGVNMDKYVRWGVEGERSREHSPFPLLNL